MTELEELKTGLNHIANSLSTLEKQADVIKKRIEEIEKKKQEEPETFESILRYMNSTDFGIIEPEEEYIRIDSHSILYHSLKRIEGYVNRKFGGKIDWMGRQTKYIIQYQHKLGIVQTWSATHCNYGVYSFVSEEAAKYFIKVTGDKLIQFFKTSH